MDDGSDRTVVYADCTREQIGGIGEKMAEISIIVPVYQVERYISQCIESIQAQTFYDFELILIDDGSTDSSGKICDQYAEKDARIQVVHTNNEGAAAARNIGLDLACGSYIVFVDGDDYVSEDMLLKLYETIKGSSYDLVVCDFLNIHENPTEDFCVGLSEKTVTGREVMANLKNRKNYGVWTIVWNKIYPRKLLEGIQFPKGKYFEDEFFSDQLYLKCNQIHMIPDVLCIHRVLSSSTMNTQKKENYLDLIDALKQRIRLYFKHGLPEDEIYRILVYLLEPYTVCKQAHFTGKSRHRLQEDYRFIKKVTRRLYDTQLSGVKKCSLFFIALMPKTTYQIAMRFRETLEKYL